ncbi:LacI family DNA-binding transcriptional regulator [Butyrivibrio sp. NC3005]|uniref:LacI family DNA-binding transcriptional regulator n=1 Tax=Butyrivibrio sp. NC3005 TaxID=1280685 RepID=UPI00041F47E5|nr:LacI family DNA-binding transcriptional regulator [Butyrivibrio sp. NC3005]
MPHMTIVEIAKKCGVGVSTVSRALNDHDDINPETKKKIMKVIRQTGYVPNNSARNLKRTDAKCIAVLIKGITNPFFAPMISIIEEETKKNGYALVLRHVGDGENEADVAVALEKEKRLRGIVFLGGNCFHQATKLKKLSVPVVFAATGNPVEGSINRSSYSSLAVDDRIESYNMVQYLISKGHRKIAIIAEGDEKKLSIGYKRLEGYLDALKAAGIPEKEERICLVDKVENLYSMENGYKATQKLLDKDDEFTAIFCVSDSLALGAMRALKDAGKRIPEDISIAGFDGLDMDNYLIPRLTTMQQPRELIAGETITLLFDIIEGKKQHQHVVFKGKLIEGESTQNFL